MTDMPSGGGAEAQEPSAAVEPQVFETVANADKRGRSTELRAALISAAVALAIGLPTVLVSYWSTSRQIESNAVQARADFVREQRQVAYSTLVADLASLESTFRAFANRYPQGNATADELTELLQEFRARLVDTNVHLASAQIIASANTSGLVNETQHLEEDAFYLGAGLSDIALIDTLTPENRDTRAGTLLDLLVRLQTDQTKFIAAARDDQLNG